MIRFSGGHLNVKIVVFASPAWEIINDWLSSPAAPLRLITYAQVGTAILFLFTFDCFAISLLLAAVYNISSLNIQPCNHFAERNISQVIPPSLFKKLQLWNVNMTSRKSSTELIEW